MKKPETASETLETVRQIARRELGSSGNLDRETRLIEDLELDSIRLMTLAMAVEDHYSVCLDEEDEQAILTLGDLVDTIERKRAGA
ncbi:MAG: acyl carrier protein [Acidobacteriota bacterium]